MKTKVRRRKGYFYEVSKIEDSFLICISLTYPVSGTIWREIKYKVANKKQVQFILRCFAIRYRFLVHSHYVGIMYGHERGS